VPELPDVTVYVERLRALLVGQVLLRVRLGSPFVLRSVEPPLSSVAGRIIREVHRIGKRIAFELDGEAFLVVHLMIAGRLHWRRAGSKLARRLGLAAFDFERGTLVLTEAGTKRRASLHVASGASALAAFDRGGIDALGAPAGAFADALVRENHTLKRALTDPRLFDGIGNAYSDEILHRARLSPFRQTAQLRDDEIARLHAATRAVLTEWTERLRAEAGTGLPEGVTAFREGMAVHGRYRQPCPECGAPVQRIVYAENECNYCARCQTGGRLLADRALSRLLKDDWPRTYDELEERRAGARRSARNSRRACS
jgi:formamidopyrimidine-DNA glycosylase